MILKKNFYFIILFFVLFFFGIIFLIFRNNSMSKKESQSLILPTDVVIPTVDSSVKVEFKPLKKGEAVLIISNEPKGTEAIDFELSYKVLNNDFSDQEKELIEQGVIGKCYKFDKSWQCGEENDNGRKIVFGTCSSGVCRYHNIVGPIKLNLKFAGTYGEKIYENEFKI